MQGLETQHRNDKAEDIRYCERLLVLLGVFNGKAPDRPGQLPVTLETYRRKPHTVQYWKEIVFQSRKIKSPNAY
jgi:hypothetical protein